MNETDKLIGDQFKRLPEALQRAIKAVPWKALVQDIGKANVLDTEQIVSLEQETMFIIYGFENPDDYVSNVIKNVGVSEDVAYVIAESAVNKVFDPILKKSEEYENKTESNLVDNVHDESSAESIRKILKANVGEDRDKLIENQLKRLPETLQQAIKIVPWKSVVKEIALLNKLDLTQIVAVEREAMFVIYGFEDEKNYLSNIMREAKLEEALATTIRAALNERVFKVIVNKASESRSAPKNITANVPEIPPVNLPTVEEGEVAHSVPHTEQPATPQRESKPLTKPPDYRYQDGKDPYREPLV